MFLLTMLQTPFLKSTHTSKLFNQHDHDAILYGYASLLHRWKHFYKRTQILSQIDHNCQSPASIGQATSTIIMCTVCSQPVLGQYFLCAVCGHGGHLRHVHEWFSSEEKNPKQCPQKDCTCRCIVKQQELLLINTIQIQQQQQHAATLTSRAHIIRQTSGNTRPT
jgi:hypothetical protein